VPVDDQAAKSPAPLTVTRTAPSAVRTEYSRVVSRSSTTRTTLALNCEARTLRIAPRVTRSYASVGMPSRAPSMSSTTR
jgi:hypothetical protein